jgi:peptidoglycan/LPS O-acetylase OafA/YrhL
MSLGTITTSNSPGADRPRPSVVSSRIPELDGLRGTAIFLVVVFHYLEQQGNVARGGLTSILQRLVLMGWSGVDLFFVLSGFLIGGILLDARNSPSYFRAFYMRRFFRIIPVYYLWILAYIVLVGIASPVLRAHSNSGLIMAPNASIYSYFLFLQNFMLVPFGGLAGAWFSHLWSLAVEEQFYLVSPLLVRLFSTRRLMTFLICVIATAPLLRILLRTAHTDPGLVSVLMPCRADSLAIGMLAAMFWRRDRFRQWLSVHSKMLHAFLAALFAGVVALWKWSPQSQTWGMESIGFTWLAMFYVVILLLALVRREGPIARLARMSWLRELGRVSYCVYIIHLAVNVICHSMLRGASPKTLDLRGAGVTLLAALTTYGIAWCSWKFLEGPLLRIGHLSRYGPAAGMAMNPGSQ